MSSEVLPYTVEPHPVTGVYSGKLGTWLFLASEVMLFGSLFSALVLLRFSAPETGPAAWPATGEAAGLSWKIGALNTFILICSSVTMVMSWYSGKLGDLSKARMWLVVTIVLACAFIAIKLIFEYIPKFDHGNVPSKSNFYGLYYTMTGLHALHIIGGVVVMLYLVGPGASLWHKDPEYYTNRLECTGLYWHFVDLVWIFLFPILYLL